MTFTRSSTTAVQFSLVANPAVALSSTQSSTLQMGITGATNRIISLLNRSDRTALMTSLFATAGTASTTFNSSLTNLFSLLSRSGLRLQVEVRSAAEMNGAAAAYAPVAPGGVAKVYLNADLLSNGTTSEQITWLLLEQFGHAVDRYLNGNLDATGDEGKAFAQALTGRSLTDAEQATLGRDAAGGVVNINGTAVAVESEANQGPTLSATASGASFTEAAGLAAQAAAVALFSNASVSVGGATERWQTINALSLSVSGLRDGSDEVLWVDGSAIRLGSAATGSTASNGLAWSLSLTSNANGTSTATLSFSKASGLSTAATAALINAISYQNTNADD
ncbi:MAG: hypothetical protein VKK97_04240, partial [Synechococcaceae cyanobacterium]|nr:hypothetical protein [Synechococcaceae cyanobacterium]